MSAPDGGAPAQECPAQECQNQNVPTPEELALDGVRYVDLPQAGLIWRLGGTNPRWREELPMQAGRPEAEDLRALAASGLWLGQGPKPPLAVACCGLGSPWPHMGRELYDNFPAARAGMERIAAAADWDVLALLDEADAEKISHTRWQQPYLFLLEYGQWSQFSALGLEPDMLCGHSLGELIALCLAGIYSPEVAWYILDTRAVHMAEMEAMSLRENGMMAVHADAGAIAQVRETWPDLLVSNYNTPRQFILSGPRDALTEARRRLRKQHIPAIVLNVGLAYHHPAMRILHDLSQRRLNALPMNAPAVPVLSSVTAGAYPADQPSICRYITELDENPVRWTDCVQAMYARGISHFLEIGPQDTLCSLIADNEPRARCLPAGRKGHETEHMRQACARLYALGFLSRQAVRAACMTARSGPSPEAKRAAPAARQISGQDPEFVACVATLADLLAAAADFPRDEIGPETDLRYDLSLRSSRFPLLVQEIEEATGARLFFENLLGVTCVGDLARAVCAAQTRPGLPEQEESPRARTVEPEAAPARIMQPVPPVSRRFVEVPEISTLVFLPALPEPDSTELEGACHFSCFADPALAAHLSRQTAGTPCLPAARAMLALAEGACLLFPELTAYGYSDIRFAAPLALPPGVTRECSLTVKRQAEFAHDGLMTRMCRVALNARDITANGRRTNTLARVMNATVHMTAEAYAAGPHWPASAATGQDISVRNYYEAVGAGLPWQLVTACAVLPDGLYRAAMPPRNCRGDEYIAQNKNSRYNDILCIVEAIVQTAQMALAAGAGLTAAPETVLDFLRPWRLNAAGFVIFHTLKPEAEARSIHMRKSWDDGTTARFDAQAADMRGRPLATLHHLEFLRQAETAPTDK